MPFDPVALISRQAAASLWTRAVWRQRGRLLAVVFGEMRADSFSAGLARPVVVGTVPGVRVVVAAASGLPTRYPAGLEAALAEKPERLQFRLERVVLLRVREHRVAAGHRFTA